MQTDPIFYADDMNMYAYVGNDPVNKTDPSGMAMMPYNGGDPSCHTDSCNHTAWTGFGRYLPGNSNSNNNNGSSVPKFDEKDSRFHHYNVYHSCNKSDSNCTLKGAKDGLSRYPAPGASGQPVVNGGVSFAVPVGSVRHVVSADGTIVNVTLEGRHLLHPGIVMRWVSEDSQSVTVHTYGEGTGPLPELNEALAETLWSAVDSNIFKYMHTTESP